ncbi:zinc finger BED domain-containing protein 4-like [Pleuronectes platessa]|uniref:zinc finger BED domain-containing protein 4-like n=1 Tax=Pleuronectes platessa TaxID=8262 RepID=UPI00232A34AB|nr:zinc finger BED domain-containing protein 4-like [Pleuronectes platessa]
MRCPSVAKLSATSNTAPLLELNAEQENRMQVQQPLIQDVPTRWNSTLDMVKRLIGNKDAVTAALDQHNHKLVMLTQQEWDKLQRLESLLDPCKYVTEILGGEAYVSCSVVLPALCHLRHVMEVTEDDPAYVVKFKTAFKTDLASRQKNTNNEWLKIATALDPRFKDLKSLPKSERPEVWTTLERLLQEQSPRARRAPQAAEDGPPKKKMSLLVMGSDSESEEEVQQPHRALHRYRAEPSIGMEDCPLEWWSSHSGAHEQLASLARKYLASPASTYASPTG